MWGDCPTPCASLGRVYGFNFSLFILEFKELALEVPERIMQRNEVKGELVSCYLPLTKRERITLCPKGAVLKNCSPCPTASEMGQGTKSLVGCRGKAPCPAEQNRQKRYPCEFVQGSQGRFTSLSGLQFHSNLFFKFVSFSVFVAYTHSVRMRTFEYNFWINSISSRINLLQKCWTSFRSFTKCLKCSAYGL